MLIQYIGSDDVSDLPDGISVVTGLFQNYEVICKLRPRIKYLTQGAMAEKEIDILYVCAGKIVGVTGLYPSPDDPGVLWLTYLSVDPDYKNRGIGKQMAEAAVGYANQRGLTLSVSTYSEEGRKFLRPVMQRLRQSLHPQMLQSDEHEWLRATAGSGH